MQIINEPEGLYQPLRQIELFASKKVRDNQQHAQQQELKEIDGSIVQFNKKYPEYSQKFSHLPINTNSTVVQFFGQKKSRKSLIYQIFKGQNWRGIIKISSQLKILYDKLQNIFNQDQFLDDLNTQLKNSTKFYQQSFNQKQQSLHSRLAHNLIILKNNMISFYKEIMKDYIQKLKIFERQYKQSTKAIKIFQREKFRIKESLTGEISDQFFQN